MNASSRSSPSRSRSLVGSSSSSTSYRLSSSEASPARAACPPDSAVMAASARSPPPRAASAASARSGRSAPPSPSHRSRAWAYASSAPGPPAARAWAAASIASCAAATPVRRARKPAHGLALDALGLLGEVAGRGVRRGQPHRPRLRPADPGEQAQQGRLAGAVRPHQPHDIARRDDEIEAGEQRAGANAGGQPGGLQRRAHARTLPHAGRARGLEDHELARSGHKVRRRTPDCVPKVPIPTMPTTGMSPTTADT